MEEEMTTMIYNEVDYFVRLKKYFGFHIEGLEVQRDAGRWMAQIVYCDFKPVEQVRSELNAVFPELEIVKLKRMFSYSAELWALGRMMDDPCEFPEPEIWYKNVNNYLERTDLSELARLQLRLRDLSGVEDIQYLDFEKKIKSDNDLVSNAHIE